MLGRIAGLAQRGVEYAKAHPGMTAAGAIGASALGYGAWSMMRPNVASDGIAQQQAIATQIREQEMGGVMMPRTGAESASATGITSGPLPTEVWLKERQRTAKDYEKALDEAKVAAFYNKSLGGNLQPNSGASNQNVW